MLFNSYSYYIIGLYKKCNNVMLYSEHITCIFNIYNT